MTRKFSVYSGSYSELLSVDDAANPGIALNENTTITSNNPTGLTAEQSVLQIAPSTFTIHTGYSTQRFNWFRGPTITADQAGQTITTAATLAIAGQPVTSAAGGFTPTITTGIALWVQSALSQFDGPVKIDPALSAGQSLTIIPGDAVGGTTTERLSLVSQLPLLTVAGSYANQRTNFFGTPTISANAGGLTVTSAATVAIQNAPATSAASGFTPTLTNAYALWVQAGLTELDGDPGLKFGTAVSRIVGGGTSLSLRNNANSADNLILTDAGAATIRAGLTITAGGETITAGDLAITAGKITMATAASQLVPGATSFSLRNNANNADNLIIVDAGGATFRGTITTASSAPGVNFNYAVTASGSGAAPTLPANTPTGATGGTLKWIQVQVNGTTTYLLGAQ